jgi:hypothetical protein
LYRYLFFFSWRLIITANPFWKIKIEKNTAMLIYWSLRKINLKTNAIQQQLTKKRYASVVFPYTQSKSWRWILKVSKSSNILFFTYQDLSKKNLYLVSHLLIWVLAAIWTVYKWGTGQSLLPLYSSPATTCHEMAHQIGFMSERSAIL